MYVTVGFYIRQLLNPLSLILAVVICPVRCLDYLHPKLNVCKC